MGCSRCQEIPNTSFKNDDIFISLPTNHHLDLFESALEKRGYDYSIQEGGYLVKNTGLQDLTSYLSKSVFNSLEQKDVMILPLESGESLKFSSLKNYRSLAEWIVLHHGREVAEIIKEARIMTLFQPIIEAETGDVYGYEALSRGVLGDGSIMNPGKLFSTARDMDMMFFLDRVCREASIRAASLQGIKKKVFINFIPTAIYEPSLCLQTTARALSEENIDSDQVVFEVVETEKVEDFGHLNHILDFYRDKGYSTALDDIGSGYADIKSLLKLKPDYMKIDMEIIRDIHRDSKKQETLDEFIRNGKEIGLKILAEGIETVEEYRYLLTKEVDLMQGYLFGKPEEVPVAQIQMPE